ncbi:hypothetical protein J7J12_01195 [bacterium]|nr:hypothetical protein [bacterium]
MTNNLNRFYKQLRKARARASKDVKDNFANLSQYLGQVDPIKLLSQLTLTFLFIPEDEFVEENSDTLKWARWIEFLAGYIVSHEYPQKARSNIDGRDLEKIEKLLGEYFRSISIFLTTSNAYNDKVDEIDKEIESLIKSLKIHSLYVRGESYPYFLRETAERIYTPHNKWFLNNLGFTISDALLISESIVNEYNQRVNNEKQLCSERARKHVNELIKNGKANENDRKDLEVKFGCYYYFSNADKILSFTLDDLVRFSKQPKEKCERYLARLSQKFGYRNPKHNDTYKDPYTAPWDYNTLYERPIISHNGKYFAPLPPLFNETLLHTFYYDLIGDDQYWKKEGEKKYGSWLEQEVASLLKNIFPENKIFINPQYPNGNELCDVLVLHDRKVFIIQCKAKKLRYEAKIGKDYQLIKDDLVKSIKESFEQASRAREYFFNNKRAKIKVSHGEIVVDSRQISDIFPVSITLGDYQNLTTRLANINPALNLFSNNQYPWAVSLLDLRTISELIDYPSMFIHYVKRRLGVERTNFRLMADETDLLGFYFSQRLYFETDKFKRMDRVALTGFSNDIDRYLFEKYERGENPKKPKQKMPTQFEKYLQNIESLESSYKTDCAMRLLDLSYQGREMFVNAAEQVKEKTTKNDGLHSFSTVINNNNLGLSFIAMNANNNIETLFKQVFSFAVMKKYTTKCKEWVGFGWDKNSKNLIDVAVFLSFDWREDPEIARIAKENLKPGQMIDIEEIKKRG